VCAFEDGEVKVIPKANGGERPLGIPTIRDRVIQTAAKIVIEPIFEADFEDNAYGYRPARGAVDAVKEVHRHLCRGYADVVDADLSKYFDTIPHSELIKSVARRAVDRNVLRLIKMWLRAPIEERDADGTRRMSGGKRNTRGTPQGGVASPLLANIGGFGGGGFRGRGFGGYGGGYGYGYGGGYYGGTDTPTGMPATMTTMTMWAAVIWFAIA
jgi:group II intron reverse transcriptase/maturase